MKGAAMHESKNTRICAGMINLSIRQLTGSLFIIQEPKLVWLHPYDSCVMASSRCRAVVLNEPYDPVLFPLNKHVISRSKDRYSECAGQDVGML